MQDGRVCVFYKEFMRDKHLLPQGGKGWPVFKPDANLDLSQLETMPTLPLPNFADIEKRLQVKLSLATLCYIK